MNEIFQFLADLLSKVEFWSVSTLGIGVSTILATIWVNRSNRSLVKSNLVQKNLELEIKDVKVENKQLKEAVIRQGEAIELLAKQSTVVNDNIYILATAANIGADNKQIVKDNYMTVNKAAPQVKAVEHVKHVVIKELSEKAEEIKSKSSLQDLLKKI